MNVFEITIQRKYQDSWPVVIEHTKPGQLGPSRRQGIFKINGEDDIATLRALIAQPRKYGTILGTTLFNDRIRDAFIEALASLEDSKNAEKYLHVLLYVEADDLKELQWQKLCSPLDGDWDFLCLNQRTPFSLYIPTITEQLFPAIGRRDLRALVVAASPSGLGKFQLKDFDVEAAVATVKAALGEIPTDVLAKVDGAIGPPTLDALMQCLTNSEKYYTLIHFVCHGKLLSNKETALYLATDDNQVAPVNAKRLRVHGNVDLALSEATAGLQDRYDITVPALFSRLGGRSLFSDIPDRPLTSEEIRYGYGYLEKLLLERAPVLSDELHQQIAVWKRTLGTDTREALQEQQQALDVINKISSEVLDLSFPALALGTEPPGAMRFCEIP